MPDQDRTLTRIEQALAAFNAVPTWAGWEQLRRQHSRYVRTHFLFPGRELELISAVWNAVCEGPYRVLGWKRDTFVQAVNDLVAAGVVFRLVHPDHIGARLVHLEVSGQGDCCYAKLADDVIGAIMLDNAEVVIWLYPVLASHQAQIPTLSITEV